MIKWFKTLFRIVRDYDAVQNDTNNAFVKAFRQIDGAITDSSMAVDRAIAAEQVIRERTDVSVDAHYRSPAPSTVIVAGRYRNQDYVQVYGFDHDDFEYLVRHLKDMERHAAIRRIDGPPMIRDIMEHEFFDLGD